MKITAVTVAERPELFETADRLACSAWPEFLMHVNTANAHFFEFVQTFPDHQFILLSEDKTVIGVVNSVPLSLPDGPGTLGDDGWDWAVVKSLTDRKEGRETETLVGLQVVIDPALQGQHLSEQAVALLRQFRKTRGYRQLIIPVRPTAKHLYPLIPLKEYAFWTRDDGLPFDPWLRVHRRQGGTILRVCENSMRVEQPVADWAAWTGLTFPATGNYLIPKALCPVRMNRETEIGLYIEPNVWVLHQQPEKSYSSG